MSVSLLAGKGIWIRRIVACEQGDHTAIVSRAQAAGFTHVILKIADGAEAYNADPLTGDAEALIRRLRDAGLSVWGWHYIYGDKPRFKGPFQTNYHAFEAERAVQVTNHLREAGLQGYVINAEGEYERAPGRADKAGEFVARVRAGLGDFPLALASWKYPNSHKRFPWAQFRQHCVLDLPQVFWLGRHREAAAQLEKSFQQYATLEPWLPYLPVAPALFENGWRPSPADLEQFTARVQTLGLLGFSLWAWDYLGLRGDETSGNPERLDFRAHWQVAADIEWKDIPTAVAPQPLPAERMPDEWAAELADLIADEADSELPIADIATGPAVEAIDATPLELTSFGVESGEPKPFEDLGEVAFSLPIGAPEAGFTPEPLPLAESEEIRARVQEAAERYADSFRGLRSAHRDQLIALGAQTLLGAPAQTEGEGPTISLAGQVVGEAHVGLPEVADQPPTPPPADELWPGELTVELEALIASDDDDDDLPDWLREAELETRFEDEAEPTRPFAPEAVAPELMPDEWMAELATLTATDESADDDSNLPDWLREAELESLTDDDAEPTRPFAPEALALELMPEELVAELEALTATDDDDADLPDWLREAELETLSEDDAEPARPFAPEAAALDLMPEELVAELEALKAGEGEDAEADADLPEWLRDFDLDASEAQLSDEDAEPARPFASEVEEFALTLMPEELAAELASLMTSEDAEADADLPEWLQDFDIEAIEARLREADAEPARPFAPEPEAAIGTLIAPPVATTTTSPTIRKFFDAIRQGRLEEAFRLYAPEFTLIHARHMARDRAGLRQFYLWVLPSLQRETLVVRSLHVNRLTVQAHWACQSLNGRMIEGADTFHLNRRDQIVYHHTTLDLDPDST